MWSNLCDLLSMERYGSFALMGLTVVGIRVGAKVFYKIMDAWNKF